jgi:PST family polysaccharide transporter
MSATKIDLKRGNVGSITVPAEDLKRRTVQGGFVAIGSQGAKILLRMGSMVVMARLLVPEEFGIVGMVTAVTGILGMFIDLGLSSVTIQRSDITEEQISTLFWINMAVGATLGILSFAIAPVLVSFYREPRLFWVTAALGVGFVFNGASQQHNALLQRQMRFIALSVIEILTLLASIAVGIAMALGGFGYWALVAMSLAIPAGFAVSVWIATSWVPGMPRRGVGIRSMLHFGGTLALKDLVAFLAYNSGNVLLGRFWGAEALGIYGRAYQLIYLPSEQLNSAVGWVAFPTLSRLQDDPDRFRNYFLRGYSLILGMIVPIIMACSLYANEIIYVFLGPKWSSAAPIFRFLSPMVLAFALIHPFGWLLLSSGRVRRSLHMALVISPVVIAGYVAGLRYGAAGVAIGYSTAMVLLIVPMIAWAVQGSPVSTRDVVQTVRRPFISGVAAGAIAFGADFFFGKSLTPFPRLLLGGFVLLGSYLWLLLHVMGQKETYLDLLRELRKRSAVGKEEVI